jgi:conjugal transfer ATP-binding protein TraC
MAIELSKVFPVQAIENGFLINGEGDITAGFHVRNPEVFALTRQELETNYREFVSIIRMLPPGTLFHKQDFIYEYPAWLEKQDRSITEKADFELYNQKPVLGSYSNIYITFCHREEYKRGVLKSSLVRARDYIFENPFAGYEKRFGDIEKRIMTLENSLKTLRGFEVKRMGNNELGCALYDYFAGSFENPSTGYADKTIPPVEVKNDSLVTGNNLVKILSLTMEGSSLYSWKENITAEREVFGTRAEYVGDINLPTSYVYPIGIGLPAKHILNTCIEVLDNELLERELRGRIPGYKLLASLGNTQSRHKALKVEEYIENITKFDYKSCRVTVNVILFENQSARERMEYLVSAAQGSFSKMAGARAWVENYDTANLFFGSCPGNARENPREFVTTVEHAVCYLSKETHYFSSKSGFLYCDRFGKPIFVDILDSPTSQTRTAFASAPRDRESLSGLMGLSTRA